MAQASQHQLAELLVKLSTNGLTKETALFIAAEECTISPFISGAHPHGKCAELISMSMRNNLRNPASPWVVVNPPNAPPNYVGCYLNPDPTSARDLLYEIQLPGDKRIFVPGAQVKVGSPRYVAKSLLRHAHDPRYSKICDVDSRLVNPDGSPRVAANAFTRGQAEALKKAGFKFVGVEHLEQDAKRVHAGLKGIYEHERIEYERELTIRANYAPRQIAWRAGYAGGIAFAIIAGAASYQQYSFYRKAVKEGRVKNDPATKREYAKQATKSVAKQAAIGGAIAVAATVIEAVVFHAAKIVTNSKTALLVAALPVCFAAVAVDIYYEYALVKRGESTIGWAIFHGTLKVAADVLPLALATFGPAGSLIGVGFSIGIRWCSDYIRKLEAEIGDMLPAT